MIVVNRNGIMMILGTGKILMTVINQKINEIIEARETLHEVKYVLKSP